MKPAFVALLLAGCVEAPETFLDAASGPQSASGVVTYTAPDLTQPAASEAVAGGQSLAITDSMRQACPTYTDAQIRAAVDSLQASYDQNDDRLNGQQTLYYAGLIARQDWKCADALAFAVYSR